MISRGEIISNSGEVIMALAAFDTLMFTKRLIQGGATPQLAEAAAEALGDAAEEAGLATRSDMERLEAKIAAGLTQAKRETAESTVELKTEIADLRTEVAESKAELKTRIVDLKVEVAESKAEFRAEITEVKGEIVASRAETKAEIAELRAEVAGIKTDMIKWMAGLAFAQVAIMLGVLIKIL